MDSIGAEVGQKMRSAIKAKLMELDCYVDDELPDYIMVMVANRRTKSQMNEDLNLFLSTKTSIFVNWLHIVLKKLKEVTVTNPDVYKRAIKRKSAELPPDDKNSLKVKKEKFQKKVKNEAKQGNSITDNLPMSANKLLSENRKIIICNADADLSNDNAVDDSFDIPLLSDVNESVNEQELQDIEKKIRSVKSRLGLLVESDNEESAANRKTEDGQFSDQTEAENTNARQIHLLDKEIAGLEDRESYTPTRTTNTDIELQSDTNKTEKKSQHTRITFQTSDSESASVSSRLTSKMRHDDLRDRFTDRDRSSSKNRVGSKRPSILDRLGTRMASPDRARQKETKSTGYQGFRKRSPSRDRDRSSWLSDRLRDRRTRSDSRNRTRSKSRERSPLRSKDKSKEREAILGRLGVQSKVAVIKKVATVPSSDDEDEQVTREVKSLIKVKPRVISSDAAQPNKNLLLKAVADAQRSVAQAPKVGKEVKPDSLFTKKYQDKRPVRTSRGSPEPGKIKLRDLIKQSSSRMRSRPQASSDEYDSDREYTPRPIRKSERDVPMYIPSSKSSSETESKENDTKEGSKQQFIITLDGIDKLAFVDNKKSPVNIRPHTPPKKPPPPIGSEKAKKVTSRPDIPDKLPIVRTPLSVKNKERCKYWPGCRQGDKCEFVHPTENCMMFPKCKYGEKCLYLHPQCKFGSSCTKRDCPYDHAAVSTSIGSKVSVISAGVQNCKFYPNCANASSCPFYHPKPCKYGKFCKNISECVFSHSFTPNKKNMSWKSK